MVYAFIAILDFDVSISASEIGVHIVVVELYTLPGECMLTGLL
jgi:hypothetical protein